MRSLLVTRAQAVARKATAGDTEVRMFVTTLISLYDEVEDLQKRVAAADAENQRLAARLHDALASTRPAPTVVTVPVAHTEPSREDKLDEIRARHGWVKRDNSKRTCHDER